MENPIDDVKIVSLPDECEMYKVVKDPKSGKMQWKID